MLLVVLSLAMLLVVLLALSLAPPWALPGVLPQALEGHIMTRHHQAPSVPGVRCHGAPLVIRVSWHLDRREKIKIALGTGACVPRVTRTTPANVQEMADIMVVPVVVDVPRRGGEILHAISTGMLQGARAYATLTGQHTADLCTCVSCRLMVG